MSAEDKVIDTVEAIESQPVETVAEKAKKKLTEERDKQKNKDFAVPVVTHLLKRIEEDPGLAEDIVQEHKTWEKCFNYITEQARKKLDGKSGPVEDRVVYEWSEDYYRKDDKAEEEEKARKEEERKKKLEEDRKKRTEQAAKKKAKETKKEEKKPEEVKAEEKKPENKPISIPKSKKDVEGQMDLFSMFAQEGV